MKSSLKNGGSFWSPKPPSQFSSRDIESILGAVIRLPLPYWQPRMFFLGARDKELLQLTERRFPVKPKRSHPIFSLEALPDRVGFRVCPCSSRKPYDTRRYRFIEKGCTLLHTGNSMDRNSYLVEKVTFNIPPSVARALRFWGEVPGNCMGEGNS